MIRHIFKIIWNERKTNGWIVLEFLVVFIVLWFCFDYMYYTVYTFYEPLGFDIEHTYQINMQRSDEKIENFSMTDYEMATTFQNRVSQYPGVESISFAESSIPYGKSLMSLSMLVNNDSIYQSLYVRSVNPAFFDVFKIKVIKGKTFRDNDADKLNKVVISPGRYNKFGEYPNELYPIEDLKFLKYDKEDTSPKEVIGVVEKLSTSINHPFTSNVFYLLRNEEMNLGDNEIVLRISPAAEEGFAKRFNNDMKEQLSIGPYIFHSVTSLKENEKSNIEQTLNENLKSVMAIVFFLFVNIFLGIIGTFWSRVHSRRPEIGLRLALGSSVLQAKRMLITETLIMLFIASILGVYICLNLQQADIISGLGIPQANRVKAGFGAEQDFIISFITFVFLAIISTLAVWYPTRLAANTQPADALRDE